MHRTESVDYGVVLEGEVHHDGAFTDELCGALGPEALAGLMHEPPSSPLAGADRRHA